MGIVDFTKSCGLLGLFQTLLLHFIFEVMSQYVESQKTSKIVFEFHAQKFQHESPGSFYGEKFVWSVMRKICFTLNRDAGKKLS